MTKKEARLKSGEAHMICLDCMGKLYSFDGHEDKMKPCPYKKDANGNCTGKLN